MQESHQKNFVKLRSGNELQMLTAFLFFAHEKENLTEILEEVQSCLQRLLPKLDSYSDNGFVVVFGLRAFACLVREYSKQQSDGLFLGQFEKMMERALLSGNANAITGALAAMTLDAPMHAATLIPIIQKVEISYKSMAVPPIWCWQFDECVEVIKDPSLWFNVQNKCP